MPLERSYIAEIDPDYYKMDMDQLRQEVVGLACDLVGAQNTLEFYANKTNWHGHGFDQGTENETWSPPQAEQDKGERATRTLARLQESRMERWNRRPTELR
ncbi:hypothetical protein KKF82_09200 [Patescibacteria group bacterium]|nr:hypothetical protein [Patescibacteria group bacterium]